MFRPFVIALLAVAVLAASVSALPRNGRGPVGRLVAKLKHPTRSVTRTSSSCPGGACVNGACPAPGAAAPVVPKIAVPAPKK